MKMTERGRKRKKKETNKRQDKRIRDEMTKKSEEDN
jgi:hypothetical protein